MTSQRHVLRATLACALDGCVGCGYKVIVKGDASLKPNQRPEQCARFKAALESKAQFPCIEPTMSVLVVQDDAFAFTSLLKGYLAQANQLSMATSQARATVSKAAADMPKRLKKLEQQGVRVHFDQDLADLAAHGTFDRVVWNFVEDDALLDEFFERVSECLAPGGQVLMTTKGPSVVERATKHGLHHAASLAFDRSLCPAYKVPYSDCNTLVFTASASDDAEAEASVLKGEEFELVTPEMEAEVRAVLVKSEVDEVPKPKKKAVKKEKETVDVPYEKEYFDLMNLKPKGKKHKIRKKMEYEANQEGKSRPSKRVLPVRMENGKRKKGW